jgi:hypothetical protein
MGRQQFQSIFDPKLQVKNPNGMRKRNDGYPTTDNVTPFNRISQIFQICKRQILQITLLLITIQN